MSCLDPKTDPRIVSAQTSDVRTCYLWLGSMAGRGASGCEAAEPVAWLEKRRCETARGRNASCSLTTLGMLMESSGGG